MPTTPLQQMLVYIDEYIAQLQDRKQDRLTGAPYIPMDFDEVIATMVEIRSEVVGAIGAVQN